MARTTKWMLVLTLAIGASPVSAQSPMTPSLPGSTTPSYEKIGSYPVPDHGTREWDESPRAGQGIQFYAGARLLVIAPRFESNPAFLATTIRSQGPGMPPLTLRDQGELEYNYALSPRIELGLETAQGVGARGRWWHYDQNAPTRVVTNNPIPLGSPVLARTVEGVSPLTSSGPQTGLPAVFSLRQQGVPAGTDTLTFSSSLRIDTFDFEGTFSDLQLGRWSFLLAGGGRYVEVRQTYESYIQGNVRQFLISNQSFEGIGPTVAVEARRPVLMPGLSVYGEGRLAMLFGTYEHSIAGRNQGLTPSTFPLQDQISTVTRQRFLPVIEMEMGVEYARPVGSLEYVLQSGVVSQLWPAGNGAHGYGNMGFVGFALNAGVRY